MNLYVKCLLFVLVTGCASHADQNKPDPLVKVPIIELITTDTSVARDYVADIEARKNIEIRARVQGFIDEILVDEGQAVKTGQLLFKLNDKEFRINLSRAQANFSSAQAAVQIAEVELGRIRTLVEKNVISKSELDLGQARLKEATAKKDEAQAAISEAEHKLSFTSVRSPFDGVIDRIPFKMGSLVSDGDLLTTLSDNSYMYAYFDVSENEYLQAKMAAESPFVKDKPAILVLSDGSCYPLEGKIETHESEFSENTGSIAFRAVFPNQNNILKHGASGKVRIQSKLGKVILVPQKSVFEIQDKSFVYLVGRDSIVISRSFRPLLRLADYYVVDSGLVAGQRIVYEGTQNIREGLRVTPVFKDRNSIVSSGF